jgi:hypothetical protein
MLPKRIGKSRPRRTCPGVCFANGSEMGDWKTWTCDTNRHLKNRTDNGSPQSSAHLRRVLLSAFVVLESDVTLPPFGNDLMIRTFCPLFQNVYHINNTKNDSLDGIQWGNGHRVSQDESRYTCQIPGTYVSRSE